MATLRMVQPPRRTPVFNIDRFIADCRAALTEETPEVAIRELVERAVADPAAVEAVLGTPRQGGIVALHRSPELTILNVIWTPGMSIYPHDHRMWTAIGLYGGREDNVFHRRGPDGLVVAGTKQLETGDTTLLGKAVIHSVANPLRTFTGAIHVYGGDFFSIPSREASGFPMVRRSAPSTWSGPGRSTPTRTSGGEPSVPEAERARNGPPRAASRRRGRRGGTGSRSWPPRPAGTPRLTATRSPGVSPAPGRPSARPSRSAPSP